MLNERLDRLKSSIEKTVEGNALLLAGLLEIAKQHSNEIRPYLELGDFYRSQGNLEAAVAYYDRAHEIGPHNFWPYYLRAQVAEARGDFAACYRYLDTAFEMCAGAVSKEEYSNIGKFYCDLKSVEANCDPAGIIEALSQPKRLGKPIHNALRVSLVKDEDDIIYAGLSSSYYSGLRYFVIADNSSVDYTASEIRRFAADHPEAIVYIVHDPITEHYQAAKTMGLIRLGATVLSALGLSMDWVFPLDGDEELHLAGETEDLFDLLDHATKTNMKLITYAFCNAAATSIADPPDRTEDLPGRFLLNAAPTRPPVRKVAFRLSPDAQIEEGNHYCGFDRLSGSEILVGCEVGLRLKHYPVRSVEQLRKKVVNGENSLKNFIGPDYIGEHWRRDGEAYRNDGSRFLEKRLADYIHTVASASRAAG